MARDGFWKQFSKVKALPRVKELAWRICRDIVPMHGNLCGRGMELDPLCPLCEMEPKYVVHVFCFATMSKLFGSRLSWVWGHQPCCNKGSLIFCFSFSTWLMMNLYKLFLLVCVRFGREGIVWFLTIYKLIFHDFLKNNNNWCFSFPRGRMSHVLPLGLLRLLVEFHLVMERSKSTLMLCVTMDVFACWLYGSWWI